jgi:hypothetical protein
MAPLEVVSVEPEINAARELLTSIIMLFKSSTEFVDSIPDAKSSELYIGKDHGDPRIKVGTVQAQILLFSALNFTLRYFTTLQHDLPGSTLEDCVNRVTNDISGTLSGINITSSIDLKGDNYDKKLN